MSIMQQNNELSRYNISGPLNLLHHVNRKENNLDYWYVCLVECRVNHDHLSIIRSEYIIMISCSFVDVHPAICIYQQSKSWAKTFLKITNCWTVQCRQCRVVEHVNNKLICFNSWDVTQTQTNTKHFHLYCRCLGYYIVTFKVEGKHFLFGRDSK